MIYLYTMEKRVPGMARKLARRLKTQVLRSKKIPTQMKRGDVILNYGGSTQPTWHQLINFMDITVLNHWDAVKTSSNKIQSLARLWDRDVPTLEWTTDKEVAKTYSRCVVRKLVCSTKAKGIVVVDNNEGEMELPDAPLYTAYWPKTHEFRVHVFNGEVIDYTQKKMRSKEVREAMGIKPTKYIRSYDNGWIFSRNDIIDLPEIRQLAIDATKAVGLDYCGVDILARVIKETGALKEAVVCETNSAPGMVNTTFNNYFSKIKELQETF